MSTEAKVITGVTIATVAIVIAGLFIAGSAPVPGADGITIKKDILVRDYSQTLTGKNAKVSLVEFGDFECPSCESLYPNVEKLLSTEGDNLAFTFRIIPIHAHSIQAATAAYAAGNQGKFWEMYNLLFQNQNAWSVDTANRTAIFASYASKIGLDMTKFNADIQDAKYPQQIAQDKADADAMGINATPTLIINGSEVSIGAISYDKLKELIDQAQASSSASVTGTSSSSLKSTVTVNGSSTSELK